MNKPSMIELNAEEQELLDKIVFNPPQQDAQFREILRASCEAGATLAHSLLARKAIPDIRLRYFNDPGLNISRTKKSRKQIFEANGTSGDAILRHPHFLPYLKYFVFGPDLPTEAIDGFYSAVAAQPFISGSDMDELWRITREATRRYRLNPKKASEEYYKLSLECGISEIYARSIRDNIHKMKRTT